MQVFLSASIPDSKRSTASAEPANTAAIRDCVMALARHVLPRGRLVWGGHPSITSLIRLVTLERRLEVADNVRLYQSEHFIRSLPADNIDFVDSIVVTDDMGDAEASLRHMRQEMLTRHNYDAGVFIGGDDGVLEEFELFTQHQPTARVIPVASTGAAAKIIFERVGSRLAGVDGQRLAAEVRYEELFGELLPEPVAGHTADSRRARGVGG